MLRIFIGFDRRQPLAYNVLQYSILSNASQPVSITPLVLSTLPIKRMGLTEFTYSRYLVPWLCNYQGSALFLDADMVVDADISDLFAAADHISGCGVYVNKDVLPMEWPSAMLFNCARCTSLTPEYVTSGTPQLLDEWSNGGIGGFDPAWNHCVGYSKSPTPDYHPKLIHYTAGLPIWPETNESEFAAVWRSYHAGMNASCTYNDLMRNSVHHKKVLNGDIKGLA